MLHQLVITQAVKHAAVARLGFPLTLTLVILITYALSYVVWRVIEKPARQAIVASARPRYSTRDQSSLR